MKTRVKLALVRRTLSNIRRWIELRRDRNLTNTVLIEAEALLNEYGQELEQRSNLNCLACGQLTDEPGRMHQGCISAIVSIRNEGVNITWLAEQVRRGKIVP